MWPQVVTQTTGPYKATSGNRATDFDIGTLGCSMILDQDLALHQSPALDISRTGWGDNLFSPFLTTLISPDMPFYPAGESFCLSLSSTSPLCISHHNGT